MVTTRTVQHRYRTGQEKLWNSKCPLTGVSIPALLRASHAKPWKDCTDTERIDPHNGFLLEARMDALFDQGFISFDDDGKLMISVRLGRDEIQKLGLSGVQGLPWVTSAHLPYLRWHREHVFKRL